MSSVTSISDYAGAARYLKTLKSRGVALGLDRMRGFASALGDTQKLVPCIHIAGTNGKGSVAAMLEAMLRAAGWRTGLYTSPHLVRLGERIQVDRRNLSEDQISDYVRQLWPVAENLANAGQWGMPSYFEFMTAMAFAHFAREKCDVSVIEVGLGGRLDATNIVSPEISVITSVGLDHCDFLGDTVAAIAREKAGIIKLRCPVVIGPLPACAEREVRQRASEVGVNIHSVVEEFGGDAAHYPQSNLEGRYQRINAATAVLVARTLSPKWCLTPATIQQGLNTVSWAGRWQRLEISGRTVIVDSSHNADGAEALAENVARLVKENSGRLVAVVGVLGATRAAPIISVVCRHAQQIHFVMPSQARACSFEQLRSLVPPTFHGEIFDSQIDGLFPAARECAVGRRGDVVLVTGSIYLAGEVLSRIDPSAGVNEGDLQDF